MTVLAIALAALAVVAVPAWRLAHRPGSGAATQRAETPPATAESQAAKPQPSSGPSAGGSRTPGGSRLGAGAPTRSAGPVEAIVWGAWQCAGEYTWDLGHPLLAKPCHQTSGVGIRMVGHSQALPGIQADMSISLVDVESGDVIVGPHPCTGLMFTDFAPEHTCGPFDATPPRGHRYAVLQQWVYTGRAILPGGEAWGPEFDW